MADEAQAAVAIAGLKKVYHGEGGDKVALHDIDLTVRKGDIYGIIGLSGAGKSTLVRCINGLEGYDGGSLKVQGQEVRDLDGRQLRALRRRTAMIFQSFNLMPSRTVTGNVELALLDEKLSRAERSERVGRLLDLVDLKEHADAYPAELSGGQKQRVAIARALANNPSILLSDEATSALDPNTTKSILRLLRHLHDTLGLTVIIITHQMEVIKQICNRVAVIDQGTIVEEGRVFDIFANPQAELTRSFVATTSNLDKIDDLLADGSELIRLGEGDVLIRMRYVSKEVSEALVSSISRNFDIDVNIVFGDIDVIEDAPLGGLVVVLKGAAESIHGAIAYLKERNIGIEVIRS